MSRVAVSRNSLIRNPHINFSIFLHREAREKWGGSQENREEILPIPAKPRLEVRLVVWKDVTEQEPHRNCEEKDIRLLVSNPRGYEK